MQKDLMFRANAIRRELVTWHLIMSFLTSNFLYQIDLGHCAYFMCVELNIWFWRDLRTTGESNEVPNTLVLASFTTIDQWQYVAIVFRWLTCAPAFNLRLHDACERQLCGLGSSVGYFSHSSKQAPVPISILTSTQRIRIRSQLRKSGIEWVNEIRWWYKTWCTINLSPDIKELSGSVILHCDWPSTAGGVKSSS
jgi:hypothetical protein